MITLRDYQKKFIGDLRREFAHGKRRVCGVMPCGAGKTVAVAYMVGRSAAEYGNSVIFMVHRKELIEQTAGTFEDFGIPYGIIAAGNKPDYAQKVQIASVQTLSRRLDKITPPRFVVCDECHHILASTYRRIVDAFPDAFLLGVTATPARTDGTGLGRVFETLVEGPTVSELIRSGNLSDYDAYIPPIAINRKKLHTRMGEFVRADVEKEIAHAKIMGDIIGNYKKLINGSAICYCISRAYSERMAERFREAGISACHVDCETPSDERARIIEDFRAGRVKVLCNVDLFGEGFDVPAMDGVILARPTASLVLHIQQIMRCMRPNGTGRKAVIIDHVGNINAHGLPTDEHEWTLDDKKKGKKGSFAPIKTCPNCFHVVLAAAMVCPECGHRWMAAPPKKATEDNTIELINVRERLSFRLHIDDYVKEARTMKDLYAIAAIAGYKPGWAYYQARARGIHY